MSRRLLSPSEAAEHCRAHPDWSLVDGKLERRLRFDGFPAAFAFMTRVAFAAERRDHHPAWENVYDRVTVRLWTHDAGGLTALDFALAADIDAAAGSQGAG